MNKIAKKLFSAAVIVCLSISSVAAYAAQITPSSTSITLGKNDKEISFDIFLEADSTYAGAEFGIKPSQSDVEFKSLVLSDELQNESKVQTIKDGCLYFGFFSNTNKYSTEKKKIATLNYTYISTILGWGLYGARCIEFLFSEKVIKPFMVAYSLVAILGATANLGLMWSIAETFNGLMAIPNLIALFLLSGTVVRLTKEYFATEGAK